MLKSQKLWVVIALALLLGICGVESAPAGWRALGKVVSIPGSAVNNIVLKPTAAVLRGTGDVAASTGVGVGNMVGNYSVGMVSEKAGSTTSGAMATPFRWLGDYAFQPVGNALEWTGDLMDPEANYPAPMRKIRR